MARESTTANGSTLYQVKLTLISRILQDDSVSIDGHDVSGAVEQFEEEQTGPLA